MINILHMSPWALGGSTSYVVNLAYTLQRAKVPHRIVRIAKNTEKSKRQIGKYGVFYQNVSFEAALKGGGKWLLASSPVKPEPAAQAVELIEKSGGAYVFHDPNEFKLYPHWQLAKRNRVICIRQTGLDSMPEGVFIPHPYARLATDDMAARTEHAISLARISAVKKSDWIIEANQALPDGLKVRLVGEVNRFWWKFNVEPKHPDWKFPYTAGFPREHGAAVELCKPYEYMVDLTVFKNDGGGTQYSLLEAMDAGAVPVMTHDWLKYPGPARTFGWGVEDTETLQHFLRQAASDKSIATQTKKYRAHNYAFLTEVHKPETIAAAYCQYLGV